MVLAGALALMAAAALALPEDAPRDALAVEGDLAPATAAAGATLNGEAPLDCFAGPEDYLPFPSADMVMDAWAVPGDRSLYLPLAPADKAGTFDELAVAGDEMETYAAASRYAGGWGAGEKRCVILMYHRFRATPANPYEISYYDFEAEMEYIAANGYVVISVEQLTDALQRQDPDLLPPRSVVITIDDGYRCVYEYAYPIFKQYDYPFAVYLYTDYINHGGQTLTWDEVRELANDPLCTIGAHSISHPNLANRKKARGDYDSWVWSQLTYPKRLLEAETGKSVRTFAWPYGSFNRYTLDAAIRAGYDGILTVAPGPNNLETSPYLLKRYGVYWRTTGTGFAKMLEGRQVSDEEVFGYGDLAHKDAVDQFLIP